YMGGSGGGGGGAGRTASGMAMLMGNASKILQTVSANIDRDVIEPALLQLSDLVLLTDTSGILTGEESISVLGVNVAIQRETIRQRQLEYLQATMNPTDMKIMGISGRGKVLRAVSQTIGLNGEEVVPADDQLEKLQQAQQEEQQGGAAAEQIQKGVQKGVELGIQNITKELTSGEIAAQLGMTEGPPAHVGTMPGEGGQPGQPGQPGAPGSQDAAMGQGTKQGPLQGQGGPQTHLVGSQPGAGAKPISPGIGG